MFFLAHRCAADQQVRADWMETLLGDDQTVRHYRGGVAYADSLRGIHVSADSASVRVQDAWYAFVSGVVFRDSTRELRADSLEFRENEDLAVFRGGVSYRDAQRSLQAAEMTYRQATGEISARGGVVFSLPDETANLSAPELRYDGETHLARATGRPRIALVGPEVDTLFLQSDSMVLRDDPIEIALQGGVILREAHAHARGTSAVFSDSALVLRGHPEARWRRRSRGDSLSMRAAEMVFGLADRQIRTVMLTDSVRIRFSALQDSQWVRHRIDADSALAFVQDDAINRLFAEGATRLSMHDDSGNRAQMAGDRLTLVFEAGAPDSLTLLGSGWGEFETRDGASVSRVSGREIRIRFENRRIARMAVLGEAICRHLPETDGHVRLSGDLLYLRFHQGQPDHIAVEGGVQGSYEASEEGKAP